MFTKLNSKLFVYRNLLLAVIVLPLLLTACAPANGYGAVVQEVVPCVAGDCLALQPGTIQWIFTTAFKDPANFVIALRGTTNPQYLVVVSRIANGFGVAGADLNAKTAQVICGTWMTCQDFTSLVSVALKSGHWQVLQRADVQALVGEGTAGVATGVKLASWLVTATVAGESMVAGSMAFSDDILDDILKGVFEDAGLPYSVQIDG